MNILGSIKPIDADEQQFQDLVSELLSNAIKETTYPIDFAIYASCPRAEMDPADIAVMNPNYPNEIFLVRFEDVSEESLRFCVASQNQSYSSHSLTLPRSHESSLHTISKDFLDFPNLTSFFIFDLVKYPFVSFLFTENALFKLKKK